MISKPRPAARDREAGIGFTELIIVLALAGTVIAMGVPWFRAAAATVQGDADLRILEWQIKLAREMAINQRRAIQVSFTAPNLITVTRLNIPGGTTVLSTGYLEHSARFMLFAGQIDTPDGFGRTNAVDFSGAATVMFTSDGMFTDAAGNPINGTVFIGQPGRSATSRALTIFGPTARIRTYRWNGSAWGH